MDPVKFACLISYLAGVTRHQLSQDEISNIYNLGCDMQLRSQHQCNVNELYVMMAAMKDGRKIDAIKSHRVLTGFGLKESKDAVEKYWPYAAAVD
jgi:ribosomal protein L7/L12